jgi:hypothetical protein
VALGGSTSIAAVVSLLAAPALAVAAEATDFACNVETLVTGAECVLESNAAAAPDRARQARANTRMVSALAERVCPRAARRRPGAPPDPDVVALCKRAFAEEAPRCDAGGVRPLVDAQGRFAPEGRRCYATLVQAVSRSRTATASSARCCRCLAEAGCVRSFQTCAEDPLAETSGAGACLSDACAAACSTFRPVPPIAPPPPEPQPGEPPNPSSPRAPQDAPQEPGQEREPAPPPPPTSTPTPERS